MFTSGGKGNSHQSWRGIPLPVLSMLWTPLLFGIHFSNLQILNLTQWYLWTVRCALIIHGNGPGKKKMLVESCVTYGYLSPSLQRKWYKVLRLKYTEGFIMKTLAPSITPAWCLHPIPNSLGGFWSKSLKPPPSDLVLEFSVCLMVGLGRRRVAFKPWDSKWAFL